MTDTTSPTGRLTQNVPPLQKLPKIRTAEERHRDLVNALRKHRHPYAMGWLNALVDGFLKGSDHSLTAIDQLRKDHHEFRRACAEAGIGGLS